MQPGTLERNSSSKVNKPLLAAFEFPQNKKSVCVWKNFSEHRLDFNPR
jgi:hypothetical protein